MTIYSLDVSIPDLQIVVSVPKNGLILNGIQNFSFFSDEFLAFSIALIIGNSNGQHSLSTYRLAVLEELCVN